VNYVNAPVIAQKQGIRVIETKSAEPEDFVSLVTVRVRERGGAMHLIAGTIFGRTQPRIVRIDDFRFEAIPEGPTFLIRNQDRPGVVGHVGTLLGDAGINIKRMQLGLHLSNGQALQLLSLEPMPSSQVLEAVRALPGIEMALLLDLGARVA
jgi:D-3-phosphoglycerate dehydrogenase